MALSGKQKAFIVAYNTNGFNATQAAITAGYSKRTAGQKGHDLLKVPDIKKAIEEKSQTVAEKLGITHEYVLNTINSIIIRSNTQIPVLDRKGKQVFVTLDDGTKVAAYTLLDGKTAITGTELLGKFLKMFTDKVEVANPEGETFKTEDMSLEEATNIYKQVMARKPV